MKAVLCKQFCEPDGLVIEDVPALKPGKGQVVISAKAAGVNFADSLIIQGKYQFKPPFPFSPGLECAGVIRDVGEGVTLFKPGDRVMAHSIASGGFAEELVIETGLVFHIPPQMDFTVAGGFFITYGTSHHALKDRAQIKPGETLLVLGAAGGVGLTAVELGKIMGARVIAAASTDEKLALCKKYGADEVINYSKEDLREKMKALTGGKGVDVVYDPVGGSYAEPAIRGLAPGGRFLVIGFAAGEIPKIPINLVLIKRSAIVGVFYGNWVLANETTARANFQELMDWYGAGKLKPHVSKIFPMTQTSDAINHVAGRKVEGKVVVEIGK